MSLPRTVVRGNDTRNKKGADEKFAPGVLEIIIESTAAFVPT